VTSLGREKDRPRGEKGGGGHPTHPPGEVLGRDDDFSDDAEPHATSGKRASRKKLWERSARQGTGKKKIMVSGGIAKGRSSFIWEGKRKGRRLAKEERRPSPINTTLRNTTTYERGVAEGERKGFPPSRGARSG